MKGVSRIGWIAVSLLALTVPTAAVCEMPGERMGHCAMAAPHDMASCGDEIALSTTCCAPGAAGNATDVVLNRHDETTAAPPAAGYALASSASGGPHAVRLLLLDPAPPPRAAPYRLFSALLL